MNLPRPRHHRQHGPEYGATMGFFPIDEQDHSTTSASPAATRSRSTSSRSTTKAKGSGGMTRRRSGLHRRPRARPVHRRALPGRAQSAPRTASTCSDMKPSGARHLADAFFDSRPSVLGHEGGQPNAKNRDDSRQRRFRRLHSEDDKRLRRGSTLEPRRRRHRRHHQLHQHLQPLRHARRRPPRQEANEAASPSKPWVKTSLAPGSRVVTEYYEKAGLSEISTRSASTSSATAAPPASATPAPSRSDREGHRRGRPRRRLRPLRQPQLRGPRQPARQGQLPRQPAARRRLRPRGHRRHRPGERPRRRDADGNPVYLQDIWPSQQEIKAGLASAVTSRNSSSASTATSSKATTVERVECPSGELYDWDDDSTYIQEPPFFDDMTEDPRPSRASAAPAAWVKLGDSVTTDHISPAGAIKPRTPPPASTCRTTASPRASSTATAPAAATTAS